MIKSQIEDRLLSYAFAHHQGSRFEEAANGYRRVLTHSPANPDALHLLGLLMRDKSADDARWLMVCALRVMPDLAAAWVNLAGLDRAGGATDAARAAVFRGLALAPGLATGWFIFAGLQAAGGDLPGSVVSLTRALCLDPSNGEYSRALAALREMADKPGANGVSGRHAIAVTLGRIAGYYDAAISIHGATAAGVSFTNAAHDTSLQRIVSLFDQETDEGLSVNDIGCGYGRLFELIKDHPALRGGRYWGCDISPAMIRQAKAQVKDPRAAFALTDMPKKKSDYTIVNATYNIKFDRPDDEWRDYVQECLRALAKQTDRCLAFCLLSCHARHRHSDLYYADPAEFLDFTLHDLTHNASLIHTADGEFWTIFAYGPYYLDDDY